MKGRAREGSLREQHDFTVEKAAQRVKYFAIATPSGGDTRACHSVHASQVHALFIHMCWVTLVKLLNLSVPEFYHLQNRDYDITYLAYCKDEMSSLIENTRKND